MCGGRRKDIPGALCPCIMRLIFRKDDGYVRENRKKDKLTQVEEVKESSMLLRIVTLTLMFLITG